MLDPMSTPEKLASMCQKANEIMKQSVLDTIYKTIHDQEIYFPPVHYACFKRFMAHCLSLLEFESITKMGAKNFAVCLAPCITWVEDSDIRVQEILANALKFVERVLLIGKNHSKAWQLLFPEEGEKEYYF